MHPQVLAHKKAGFLIEALEGILVIDPDRVYKICSSVVNQQGRNLADLSRGFVMWSENLVNIALALNRLEMPYREWGLNLFEKLLDLGVWRVRETLLELDRRLVPNSLSQPSRRRRRRGK